jgi:hypothetical protein
MDHVAMHKTGECTATPCEAYGVSCALYICCDYLRERDAFLSWVRYAGTLQRLPGSSLRDGIEQLAAATAQVLRASARLHEQESIATPNRPAHAHEIMCERPRQLADLGRNFVEQLEALALELRQKSTAPAFAKEPSAGRPPNLLLKAVRQHLSKDGGLEHGEIARLVPDRGEGSYTRQKDRVRKDVEDVEKGADVRWVFTSNEPGKNRVGN